jgi:hypothetical protein
MSDMQTQGQYGIFASLLRLLVFWNWKKARGITKAADKMFTKDAGSMEMAFEMENDRLVVAYNNMKHSAAGMQMEVEKKRDMLLDLEKKHALLVQRRDGAVKLAQSALKDPSLGENSKQFIDATKAFQEYNQDLAATQAEQKAISEEIAAQIPEVENVLSELTKLEKSIQKLKEQKNTKIAKFISDSEYVNLRNSLQGLKTSLESGPIDAVLKVCAETSALAKVTSKLAGTDAARQDAIYEQAAVNEDSKRLMKEMLSAMDAENNAKTGEVKPTDKKVDERPTI